MSRFSDAALLKGNFSHMAAEFRAGHRPAPRKKDWQKVACDNSAEKAAQEIAKHIFALQQNINEKTEKLNIIHLTATGPMLVMAIIPGEEDVLRLEGILAESGEPVAQILHSSKLSLTFVKAELQKEDDEDDGLTIGFVIFDELKKRQKKKNKALGKRILGTNKTIITGQDEPIK